MLPMAVARSPRQSDEIPREMGSVGGFPPHLQCIVTRSLQITSCSRRDHFVAVRAGVMWLHNAGEVWSAIALSMVIVAYLDCMSNMLLLRVWKFVVCLCMNNCPSECLSRIVIIYVMITMIMIIMAALWNRAGHYIFALWFLLPSIYLLSYFPRLIWAVADWMSAILPHMVWP